MTSMMSASTADDTTQQSLPSFTSFSAELEPSWDYYEQQQQQQQQQRPERSNSATNGSTDVIASAQTTANGSYTRPWEMDTKDNRMAPPHGGGGPPGTPGPPAPPPPVTPTGGFTEHGGFPKLPSFQSQFHSFTDTTMVTPEPSLPQVTAVPVPISPSSASPGTGGSLTQLTQLTPTPLPPIPQAGFHTLSAVNSRPYPIVPAAIPVRDLAGINHHHQHQYIDERHIQLYQPMATFQAQPLPTLAVIKKEMITRLDNRKKERRKMRASSLESSAESEGSAMEIGDSGNPGQVAAISSTANFKSPMHTMSMDTDDGGTPGEKSTKKKRKRCGECVGCSRKDNCGDCAPCRNDKSHQICKTRRCEKLTEKKLAHGMQQKCTTHRMQDGCDRSGYGGASCSDK
uniref:CXXC-type domain-containing protein n=1 Tax=Anopheles farauti TaxID=69004 RepID=A0A182QUD7_9DIPT